jgi:glucose/arabinose dehydrogenase
VAEKGEHDNRQEDAMSNRTNGDVPRIVLAAVLLIAGLPGCSGSRGGAVPAETMTLETIRLPEGFSIAVYADSVPGARSMTQGPPGVLFVGSRDIGRVYALVDGDRDNRVDTIHIVAEGLRMPNGVAYRDGALYVAEISRVLRFDDIAANLTDPPRPVVVNDSFPDDKWHGWKFIAFGPDSMLYVPVGAPCNVCLREDERYASIMRMNADGTGLEVFARGVRNTVGFDWHPGSGELWFTDNGRDWMGDNRPPDELNHAPRPGLHFGFPFCHGDSVLDPKYGEESACERYRSPALTLGPHVAALGMRFYTGEMFPEEYRHQIFIAEHGSWNRSEKIGYRVMLVRMEGDRAVSRTPFAEGWLQGEEARGRPVDVEVMPDGALLVSDDRAGAVYRISYEHGR